MNGLNQEIERELENHHAWEASLGLSAKQVFKKAMPTFKNGATSYALISEVTEQGQKFAAGTQIIIYVNAYYTQSYGEEIIPSSYSPMPYTFEFKGEKTTKALDKKGFSEVEHPEDWPEWIAPLAVAKKKPRKADKKVEAPAKGKRGRKAATKAK